MLNRVRIFTAAVVPLFLVSCASVPARCRSTGVTYEHVERSEPRPLHIHVLKIDLTNEETQLYVDVAPDPDGKGPAETTLVAPLAHAQHGDFQAGVNANPWRMVPPPPAGHHPHYVAEAKCDISGWVVVNGNERSSPHPNYWSFWVDRRGKASLGKAPTPAPDALWAITGFGGLLRNGKVLPGASTVRHPRTALGLDRDGHTLILAVVDGRQRGYSEGVSTRELAQLMLDLGCYDALNLDGGGSSVMIVRPPGKEPRIVNRPSDMTGPRPIPVFFGVRRTR